MEGGGGDQTVAGRGGRRAKGKWYRDVLQVDATWPTCSDPAVLYQCTAVASDSA